MSGIPDMSYALTHRYPGAVHFEMMWVIHVSRGACTYSYAGMEALVLLLC